MGQRSPGKACFVTQLIKRTCRTTCKLAEIGGHSARLAAGGCWQRGCGLTDRSPDHTSRHTPRRPTRAQDKTAPWLVSRPLPKKAREKSSLIRKGGRDATCPTTLVHVARARTSARCVAPLVPTPAGDTRQIRRYGDQRKSPRSSCEHVDLGRPSQGPKVSARQARGEVRLISPPAMLRDAERIEAC